VGLLNKEKIQLKKINNHQNVYSQNSSAIIIFRVQIPFFSATEEKSNGQALTRFLRLNGFCANQYNKKKKKRGD
jgi:hypothetical protein